MAIQRRTVAGLALRWREFRAIRSDGLRAEGEPIAFGLWAVADPDALVERGATEHRDDGMPYFGLIWPAAEALVAKVLTGRRLDGLRALDLGCGLGACGFAAARLGARVTFFDREPRALAAVRATAREPEWQTALLSYVVGDWARPPLLGRFDLIVGADVLYDRGNGPAVAAFLARHLEPGAEAWIADPGRATAEQFPTQAGAAGLEVVGTARLPTPAQQPDVRLLRLRQPGPP
ncbi:MAG: class I SAM-dependent methyltransferase [Chloroflexota bacterium]|nr:class I SAM-dependent methyltransferase [Chloroflexota bacterium]